MVTFDPTLGTAGSSIGKAAQVATGVVTNAASDLKNALGVPLPQDLLDASRKMLSPQPGGSCLMLYLGSTPGQNQSASLTQGLQNASQNLIDLIDRVQQSPNLADKIGNGVADVMAILDKANGPDTVVDNLQDMYKDVGLIAVGASLYFNSNSPVMKEAGYQLMRVGSKDLLRNAMDIL